MCVGTVFQVQLHGAGGWWRGGVNLKYVYRRCLESSPHKVLFLSSPCHFVSTLTGKVKRLNFPI